MTEDIFPVTGIEVEHILRNWSTLEDTCRDDPANFIISFEWPCDPTVCLDALGESMVVKQTRNLPDKVRAEATAYITHLVRVYPFQLRAEMARPMFHRFLDVWTDTGNRRLALRAI